MRNICKEIETHFAMCIQCQTYFRSSAVHTKELVNINDEPQKKAYELENIKVGGLLSFGCLRKYVL